MRFKSILFVVLGVVFLEVSVCQRNGHTGLNNVDSKGGGNNSLGFMGKLKRFLGGMGKNTEGMDKDPRTKPLVEESHPDSILYRPTYDYTSETSSTDLGKYGQVTEESDEEKKTEEDSKIPEGSLQFESEGSRGEEQSPAIKESTYDDTSAPVPELLEDAQREDLTASLPFDMKMPEKEYPGPSSEELEQVEDEDSIQREDIPYSMSEIPQEISESKMEDSDGPRLQDLFSTYSEKSGLPIRGVRIGDTGDDKEMSTSAGSISSEIPILKNYIVSSESSDQDQEELEDIKEVDKFPLKERTEHLSEESERGSAESSKEKSAERFTEKSQSKSELGDISEVEGSLGKSKFQSQEEYISEGLQEREGHPSERSRSASVKSKAKDSHYESSYDDIVKEAENSVPEYISKSENSTSELPHETYDRLIREALDGRSMGELSEKTISGKNTDNSYTSENIGVELQEGTKSSSTHTEKMIDLSNYSEKYPSIFQTKEENEAEASEENSGKYDEEVPESGHSSAIDDETEFPNDSESLQEMNEKSESDISSSEKSGNSLSSKIRRTFRSITKEIKDSDLDEVRSPLSERKYDPSELEGKENIVSNRELAENIEQEREENEQESEPEEAIMDITEEPVSMGDYSRDEHPEPNESKVKMLIKRFENESKVNRPVPITTPRNKLGFRDTERSSAEKKSIDKLINFFENENRKYKEGSVRTGPQKIPEGGSRDDKITEPVHRYGEQTLAEGKDKYSESKSYSEGIGSDTTTDLSSNYDSTSLNLEDTDFGEESDFGFYHTKQDDRDESMISSRYSHSKKSSNKEFLHPYSAGYDYITNPTATALPLSESTLGDVAGGLRLAFNLGKQVCDMSKVLLKLSSSSPLDDGVIRSPSDEEKHKLMQSISDVISEDILSLVSNTLSSE